MAFQARSRCASKINIALVQSPWSVVNTQRTVSTMSG
jgi:hypothetical protein